MWSHWQIPDLYASDENISYWNRFGMPAKQAALLHPIDHGFGEFGPWPLWTWWDKDPAKR
jgi:microcin C transport system substrate-binding protein